MTDVKKLVVVLALLAVLFLSFGCTGKQKDCNGEVRMCPDGNLVGRAGNNCDFNVCPSHTCPQYVAPSPTFCLDGNIISGGFDSYGCQSPPRCQKPFCDCPTGYVKDTNNGGEACNPLCYYDNPQCLTPSIACSIENTQVNIPFDITKIIQDPWEITFSSQLPYGALSGADCLQADIQNLSEIYTDSAGYDYNAWHKFWFCPKGWNGTFRQEGPANVKLVCDCSNFKIFHKTDGNNSRPNMSQEVIEMFR